MVGSILSSSVPAAAGLLGTALVSLCCPHAGSESRGQGPQGGFRVSFKFNQLWALIGEAWCWPSPAKCLGHTVIDLGGVSVTCAIVLRVPRAWYAGLCLPTLWAPHRWVWVGTPWCLGALVPVCPPCWGTEGVGKIWYHTACHPGATLPARLWEAWQMAECLSVLPGTHVALQACGSR